MAYTYKKLIDVELVESAVEPNLLIEDEGEIKKMPASNIAVSQIQADWDETDIDSPAFILNKPDTIGGGANVVTYTMSYTIASGASVPSLTHGYTSGYASVTAQEVIDAWDNGSIIRLNDKNNTKGSIVGISYTSASGAITSATISYFSGSNTTPSTLTI